MHAQTYHTDTLSNCVRISNDTAQVYVYHNIPYAVGKRFEPAQVLAFEAGAQSYVERGAMCPQERMDSTKWGDRGSNRMSEQCQVLTINTPYPLDSTPTDGALLPVLVHIHGGAFLYGGGEQCQNDLWEVALRGKVVTVTITHRLGVFGYLFEPKKGIGNMGVSDQLAALQWVNANIHRFGGDRQHITLSGQSAGAQSVAHLLAHPKCIALEQAILFSAPLGVQLGGCAAQGRAKYVEKHLHGEGITTCSTDSLLAVQTRYAHSHRLQIMPFAPTDLPIIPKSAPASLKRILVSVQKQDAAMFVGKCLWKAGTDVAFANPGKKYVRQWQKLGVDATYICLDWAPRGSEMGACHAVELPLFTGTPDNWIGAWFMGEVTWEELLPVRWAFEDRLIGYLYGRPW